MDYAVSVFYNVRNPDAFLWNTMIRGFCKKNDVKNVFGYYKMMGQNVDNFTLSFLVKASGESGSVLLGRQVHCSVVKYGFEGHVHVRNTLVHMYGMVKEARVARKLFDEMLEPDLVAWNTVIDCYVCCGEYKEGLELFLRMQDDGVRPDDATLSVVLSACAALGNLELGRWVHSIVSQSSLIKDLSIANSLIHMYTKCGEIQEALTIFGKLIDRNIVTYNTMILGLAAHGHVQEAFDVFSLMINRNHTPPNDVTLLGVLTACSHGGRIDKGRQYFNKLTAEYGIKPTIKHYGCMVDVLSRAGLVTEAYDLVQNMPMKCNAIVLRTLLAGCRVHGNIELAENVRRDLLEVDPDHSSDFVLLANTYASLEDWNQASRVRRSMTAKGVQKPSPGNSLAGLL
nr:pentatricopeptide repeat-containing protein At4g21065-like [Tanacetum cinerariifolium]GEY33340.1 pentatricopeptide repeat-containing protein At4g21065-like [Tanacetum cinerariifolium]